MSTSPDKTQLRIFPQTLPGPVPKKPPRRKPEIKDEIKPADEEKAPVPPSPAKPRFQLTEIQNKAISLFNSPVNELLLVGGSRSGKSFVIIYYQLQLAQQHAGSRHLIARHRFNHAKNSIWLDTLKKVIDLCYPNAEVKWKQNDSYLQFENGSQVWIAGLDDKERTEKILGMEFLTVFLNEASQISYMAYNTIKTRLAQKIDGARPFLFIDANPPSKKHWMHRIFIENVDPETNTSLNKSRYDYLKMNPDQNLANISEEYLANLDSLPLRVRRRFRDGEFTDDNEGSLWTDELINAARVRRNPDGTLPVRMRRVIVAVDPAVTSRDTSDETGIIVAGLGYTDNHLYVIADATGRYGPTEWATQAASLYHHYRADRLIAEINNGGDMVETIMRSVDADVSYKAVHATRDKLTRAEPIAAIYEQGKAHHIDELPDLELEMTTWEAKKADKSPNRIDALVWAATELCLKSTSIISKARYSFPKPEPKNRPYPGRKNGERMTGWKVT